MSTAQSQALSLNPCGYMAIKGDLHIEAKGEDPSSKIFLCLVLLVNLSGALVILPWMGSSYPHFIPLYKQSLWGSFYLFFDVKPQLFVVEQSRKKVQDQLNILQFLSWAPNKMIFWRKWCQSYSWHRLCWSVVLAESIDKAFALILYSVEDTAMG